MRSFRFAIGFAIAAASTAGLGCGSSASNPPGNGGAGAAGGGGPQGGGGAGVEETEAAVVDAFCDQASQCGAVQVVCSGGEEGPGTCSAYLQPTPYDECVQAKGIEIEALLTCAPPTAAQVAALQACAAAFGTQACPTQAELDAWVTGGGEQPGGPPAACDVLDELAHACDVVQGCQESSGGTGSGGFSSCDATWKCFSGEYHLSCSAVTGEPYECSCDNGVTFVSETCDVSVAEVNAACGYQIPGG